VLLKLLDQPEKLPVARRVVWVTPQGAQGNRPAGIGIEFSKEDAVLNGTIENYFGGALSADRVTHTLRALRSTTHGDA
jgi:type IV pilus assembly protein PilZ